MQVSWGLLCFHPPGLPGGGGEYEQFPAGSDSYGTFKGEPALLTDTCSALIAPESAVPQNHIRHAPYGIVVQGLPSVYLCLPATEQFGVRLGPRMLFETAGLAAQVLK